MEQVTIAPGHWLDAPEAASYERMRASGMPPGVNDAGRTHEEQIAMFLKHYTPNYASSSKRDRRVWNGKPYWRKAPYGSHPAVAVPGTSTHEGGHTIDVPARPQAWLREHGAEHGWKNPDWAQQVQTFEPWHWEYDGTTDEHANGAPPISEEDDMNGFTVHAKVNTDGVVDDWTLGNVTIGTELPQFKSPVTSAMSRTIRDDGNGQVVTMRRGFLATNIPSVGLAWARTYAKGDGGETTRTARAGYIDIQHALSLTAIAVAE